MRELLPRTLRPVLLLGASLTAVVAGDNPARGQDRPHGTDDAPAAPPVAPAPPTATGLSCPDDMSLVDGEYCTNVDQRCLRWLDEDTRMRCAEFAPSRCTGRRRHMSVCMDRHEYPNQPGVSPMVMVNWHEAQALCASQNKRLCTQAEWTFACEGPDMNPYPYGNARDATACRIDHQTMRPDRARLGNPATTADESARLYEAVPSGAMARCVSWAGIHDMTGNVDEWTVNESGTPFQSALKGGWWGHIRARCRPATTSHNEGFVYYQIGFRCCADPRAAGEATAAVSSPFAPRPNIRLPANPYRQRRR